MYIAIGVIGVSGFEVAVVLPVAALCLYRGGMALAVVVVEGQPYRYEVIIFRIRKGL